MPARLFKQAKARRFVLYPMVAKLTPRQVEEDAREYSALLDARSSEATIHNFLATHSYFFNGIIRLYGRSPLYSKVRLGSQYEVDFACVDTGSYGPEWRLIEIEGAKKPLVTKSGQPSSYLLNAIQQVRDWHDWVHENLDYARKIMPKIEYPLGYVFVGRRSELSPSNQKKLRRLAYDNRALLRIHTLDRFEAMGRSVLHIVSERGGCWPLPMRASSHRDLARGLPRDLMQWVDGSFARFASRVMLDDRLNERNHRYWD